MRDRGQSTKPIHVLVSGGVLILSALALAGCKGEKEEAAAATPAEVAVECQEGASRMFATDKTAEAEKFARCMAKRLGDDWLEENPELKPAE